MKALVVYESMFGNTRLIAEAIDGGLARHLEAEMVEVGEAPTSIPADIELVVVGGPTHAFGMSRSGTRRNASTMTDDRLISPGIGIREWLHSIGRAERLVRFACFDTRLDKPRLPGSAAASAAKYLRRHGYRSVTLPESFYVDDGMGPLLAGEYQRAHDWGKELGSRVSTTHSLIV